MHQVHFRDFPRLLNYLFLNLNESHQKISSLAKTPLEIPGSERVFVEIALQKKGSRKKLRSADRILYNLT